MAGKRKRNTTTGTETHGSRDKKGEDGSRLGDDQGTGGMPLVWQKRILYERMWKRGKN